MPKHLTILLLPAASSAASGAPRVTHNGCRQSPLRTTPGLARRAVRDAA
ncbi:hypothetical protein LAJ19_05660 [Deinococcus taeanensis]|nr:hypothetical protein [Deinococcus taeanensis]UBV43702.1 hypothetical protein LAJ19_05660 [Deinococcus taeanensis]